MATICFKAKPYKIGLWTLIRLPESASAKLPTRGMTMAGGSISAIPFQAALEPDGKKSHWFRLSENLCEAIGVANGNAVTVVIEPCNVWPEPEVPTDLTKALEENPAADKLWLTITPQARWDWVRWIRSTNNADTRLRRIDVACAKLRSGERRPCCFNRNHCTEPDVSHKGILMDESP